MYRRYHPKKVAQLWKIKIVRSTGGNIPIENQADMLFKLESILDGDVTLVNHETLISPDMKDIEITILPSHVKKMLHNFLDGKISADELKHWAEFVRFRGEYACKDWAIDEIADYYTDMWEIVEMTSTPELDYELTPETIRRYLKVLEKYDD